MEGSLNTKARTNRQDTRDSKLELLLDGIYGTSGNGKKPCEYPAFKKSLALMAAAGTATFAAEDVSLAAVRHSGPLNAVLDTSVDLLAIDLNNDGAVDFSVQAQLSVSTGSYPGFFSIFSVAGSTGSVAFDSGGNLAENLSAGATISNALNFKPAVPVTTTNTYTYPGILRSIVSTYGSVYDYGNFGQGFVGIKFEISGQDHFGWIQVDFTEADTLGDLTSFLTVIDWAYEDVAGQSILAGDVGGGGDPGDFNNDGSVDGEDFLRWQSDPSVGDLSDWQTNYGSPPATAVRAIPEPSSAGLALLAAGAAGIRWSRRERKAPEK